MITITIQSDAHTLAVFTARPVDAHPHHPLYHIERVDDPADRHTIGYRAHKADDGVLALAEAILALADRRGALTPV